MTIYFMGGEMSAFTANSSSVEEATGGIIAFQSGFSRCAIERGSDPTHYVKTPSLSLPDELYTHVYFRRPSSFGSTYSILSYYAGVTEVFRVQTTAASIQMQALITGVMTNVGAAVDYSAPTSEHLDVYFQGNDATGNVALYIAGTLMASATVDLSSVTGITEVRCYYPHSFSQLVIADEPTIGWRLLTRYMNGAGASAAWTGAYTDVDEIVYDDADFCNSSTNGQIEQFTQTGPAITGYSVRAVGVYARGKRGASGPSNLQIGLRVSSTDYFSANKALDVGYGAFGEIWETNPATAAAWVNTAIDAIQPSIKAVT